MQQSAEAGDQPFRTVIHVLHQIMQGELTIQVAAERLLDEEALLDDDLGIDSVGLMELITAVEERFDFEFLESDLTSANFRTVKTLARVIVERAPAGG